MPKNISMVAEFCTGEFQEEFDSEYWRVWFYDGEGDDVAEFSGRGETLTVFQTYSASIPESQRMWQVVLGILRAVKGDDFAPALPAVQ